MILMKYFFHSILNLIIIMTLEFNTALTYENLQLAYRITIFAMWGIGVDIPRLLIRYARSYPMVNNFHTISMMIIGLMTIMYTIAYTSVIYSQTTDTGLPVQLTDSPLAAFILSWILTGGIIFQFLLGFRVRYEMVSQKLSIDMFSFKAVHRYLGMFLSILGKIVVAIQLYQITLTEPDSILFRSFLFLFGALLFIFVIMQIVYRIQTRSLMLKFPLKHKSKYHALHVQILDNINNQIEDFKDYKEIGVRYIILDNVMYYIDENFIHPGSQYIFTLFNGQQVNYLFRGTHQLAPDFPRHRHTKYAINYLEERKVGEISVESLLLNHSAETMDLVDWKITALQEMDGDAVLFQFEVKDGYLRQNLKIENFGKYMMVSCPSEQVIGKVQRPYSIILSLSEYQCRILQRFKQSYKTYYLDSHSSLAKQQNEEYLQNNTSMLTFCIKKYRSGVFTNFMFSSWKDKTFSINGPYGRGLRLKGKMKNGFYIIVAAGTGVLPFIDLFHYLLLKTLYKLIVQKAGQVSAKKINEEKVDYSELDNIKILFVGSFLSPKHFYLDSVIKDLYHLNCKHNLDEFDIMLRYNNMQSEPDIRMIKQQFSTDFIKSLLEMQPTRLYYCGPSNIEHTIRKVQAQQETNTNFYYI